MAKGKKTLLETITARSDFAMAVLVVGIIAVPVLPIPPRLLGEAHTGGVINSFGNFAVKGNYVVGFIVFLILAIMQFVVITKGATRISEAAARFTLDAMPGKQMAMGFIVPPIRIRDYVRLQPKEYAVKIKGLRPAFRRLMEPSLPQLTVASYNQIHRDVEVISTGMVEMQHDSEVVHS